MLSESGINSYLRAKNIEEYKQTIKMLGAQWFEKALVPFLSRAANFATL